MIILFINNEKFINHKRVSLNMMNLRQLKEIIVQQKAELEKKEKGLERVSLKEIGKYLKLPHAVVIIGVRRCGKSTLLAQIMAEHFREDFY